MTMTNQGICRYLHIIYNFVCLRLVGFSPHRINQSNGVKVWHSYPPKASQKGDHHMSIGHNERLEVIRRFVCITYCTNI